MRKEAGRKGDQLIESLRDEVPVLVSRLVFMCSLLVQACPLSLYKGIPDDVLHEIGSFFAACVFRAILLVGGGAPALGDCPRVERPFRSDALERDYRGWGKPGCSGDRARGAGSTLPDLLGAALRFRAQSRVFGARCPGPDTELFRVSN